MADRGNREHGQWGTWLMGHGYMGIIMHGSRWWTGIMGHMGIIMHRSRWQTGVIGYMGNRAHG